MIPLTPLYSRYKDSFFLFIFRLMDLMRVSTSDKMTLNLSKELTYLYHVACLIAYKDVPEKEIAELQSWAIALPKNIKLDEMKQLFIEKMNELNLRAFLPKNYTYTFTTIWDTFHLMAMIVDDMVANRDKYNYNFITHHLNNFKSFYINIFIKLLCPVCAYHYLLTRGVMVVAIEQLEIALRKEHEGTPIVMVDEINRNKGLKNYLLTHYIVYTSMEFHNHINTYRYIQRNLGNINEYVPMQWNNYKKDLQLT
jgi:hypothetical protein